jgi:hypothetical protein
MFLLTPTPRQLEKVQIKDSAIALKPVPTNWDEFVALTTIRSGKSMIRFDPYEYQKVLVWLMEKFNNICVIKARQMGTTQAVSSKFLHDTCLNTASSSVAFMRNGDDVGSLSRRVKQMLAGLEEYVKPENDQVGYLKLKGLGDFYIKNSSKEGIRSIDSVSNLLFDESAFILNIASIYAASSPSSALVGDAITKVIVSTPSAKSGWYWDRLSENNGNRDIEEICDRVSKGELYKPIPGMYWWVDDAGVCKVVIHFLAHPVYANIHKSHPGGYLAYRQEKDGSDEETIQREYNLKFVNAATSVFVSEIVSPGAVGQHEEYRDPDAQYFMGIDCATTGGDYLVCYVIKRKFGVYSEVALHRKRQQTSEYHLSHISDLIIKYQPNVVGIETTGGVGTVYLERLQEQFKGLDFQGITTNTDSKNAMIARLVLVLEKNRFKYPSNSPIKLELLSFQRVGKKLQASEGNHDDTVMALSFAVAVGESYEGMWDDVDLTKIKKIRAN